ncbi:GxxExxY protein [Gemmatirosa kalamazoonensis]|uniref:GxxExxY protein n=2 Tax=Gemmatirosa kalamazoonensis TaxID=861299 RepID=W0RG08_9BACT|nr:GxxExxY protein [Gemmatirosa kalamazoonensis]
MEHEAQTRVIIGCAMTVHRALGPGFLESVYKNALTYELRLAGMSVEREKPLEVRYRGVMIGAFNADILVDERLLVEAKAVRALAPSHEVQTVNYLTAAGLDTGLLLNFGAPRLEFRRKWREYRKRASTG